MKKTILILLSLLLVFTTFGCKKEEKGEFDPRGVYVYESQNAFDRFIPDIVLIKNLYFRNIKYDDPNFGSILDKAEEETENTIVNFYHPEYTHDYKEDEVYESLVEKTEYVIPVFSEEYGEVSVKIPAGTYRRYGFVNIEFGSHSLSKNELGRYGSVDVIVFLENDFDKFTNYFSDFESLFEKQSDNTWVRKNTEKDTENKRYSFLLKMNDQFVMVQFNIGIDIESPEKLFDYVTFDEYSVTHLGATKIRSYQSIEDLSPSEE